MKIRIKKLHPDAVIPKYQTSGAAAFDLVALEDTTFFLGETKLVRTGLAIDTGPGYQLEVRDRSSMALKTPMRVANSPGTVDSDYRGEVCVIMTMVTNNYGDIGYVIKKGDRMAQGAVMPAILADIEVVDYLSDSSRGQNGFGSTGT